MTATLLGGRGANADRPFMAGIANEPPWDPGRSFRSKKLQQTTAHNLHTLASITAISSPAVHITNEHPHVAIEQRQTAPAMITTIPTLRRNTSTLDSDSTESETDKPVDLHRDDVTPTPQTLRIHEDPLAKQQRLLPRLITSITTPTTPAELGIAGIDEMENDSMVDYATDDTEDEARTATTSFPPAHIDNNVPDATQQDISPTNNPIDCPCTHANPKSPRRPDNYYAQQSECIAPIQSTQRALQPAYPAAQTHGNHPYGRTITNQPESRTSISHTKHIGPMHVHPGLTPTSLPSLGPMWLPRKSNKFWRLVATIWRAFVSRRSSAERKKYWTLIGMTYADDVTMRWTHVATKNIPDFTPHWSAGATRDIRASMYRHQEYSTRSTGNKRKTSPDMNILLKRELFEKEERVNDLTNSCRSLDRNSSSKLLARFIERLKDTSDANREWPCTQWLENGSCKLTASNDITLLQTNSKTRGIFNCFIHTYIFIFSNDISRQELPQAVNTKLPNLHTLKDSGLRSYDIWWIPQPTGWKRSAIASTCSVTGIDITIARLRATSSQSVDSATNNLHLQSQHLQLTEKKKLQRAKRTPKDSDDKTPGEVVIAVLLDVNHILLTGARDQHGDFVPYLRRFLYGVEPKFKHENIHTTNAFVERSWRVRAAAVVAGTPASSSRLANAGRPSGTSS